MILPQRDQFALPRVYMASGVKLTLGSGVDRVALRSGLKDELLGCETSKERGAKKDSRDIESEIGIFRVRKWRDAAWGVSWN